MAVGAVAAAVSTVPDGLERPPKWLVKHAPPLARRWPRVPHRTITHYPIVQLTATFGLFALMDLFSPLEDGFLVLLFGAVAIGLVMHSVADAATIHPKGIRLLWPISRRGFHVLPRSMRVRVDSNSRSEWLFVVLWCALLASYAYARYGSYIVA